MADDKISILVTLKDEASKGLGALSSGLKGIGSSALGIAKTGLIAITGAASAAGIASLKLAGDLEQSRMGFKTLLGSAKEADKVMSRIKKEAAATPFELPGLIEGTQALTAITKDGDKAIDVLLDVGKAVSASGKGQNELNRVILNLQQIASTGKVTAMDIRQFQGAIPIFNDIISANGLTVEALQDSENAAELLFEAFNKAGQEGGITANAFSNQMGTLNQRISNLKDSLMTAGVELVTEIGLFDKAKNLVGFLTENIESFKEVLISTISFISEFSQPIIESFIKAADFEFLKETALKFMTVLEEHMPQIKTIFSNVANIIGKIFNVFGQIVRLLIDSGALNLIIKGFEVLSGVLSTIANVMNKIAKLLREFAESELGQFLGEASKKVISTMLPGTDILLNALNKKNAFGQEMTQRTLVPMSTNSFLNTPLQSSQASRSMVSVNVENVYGTDPDEISDALQFKLSEVINY